MASGEVVIQSMWSPAVTAVKAQGIKCVYQPLKEGYRGWGNGLALMAHVDGMKRDAAYEYLNWYNSGWVGGFIAKQGYYSANPGDGEGRPDRERARLLLRRQGSDGRHHQPDRRERPTRPVTCVTAAPTRSASRKVAVWNNLMDEAEYHYAKWNEFNAA